MIVPGAILCEWNGEQMTPVGPTWAKRADKEFVVGERYYIEARQTRSEASHRHYMATVSEAWRNLPEAIADRFPSEDHLRKWALIRAGFHNSRSIATSSKADAERLAAFMRPLDDFAVIDATDSVVTVYTAKSQSWQAMGKEQFQRSKTAVLDIIADLIGSSREELQQNTDKAA